MNQSPYLISKLNEELIGFKLSEIEKIIKLNKNITQIPNNNKYLIGIVPEINRNNQKYFLPIYSLENIFCSNSNKNYLDYNRSNNSILVFNFKEQNIGIIIDSIYNVINLEKFYSLDYINEHKIISKYSKNQDSIIKIIQKENLKKYLN